MSVCGSGGRSLSLDPRQAVAPPGGEVRIGLLLSQKMEAERNANGMFW